MGWLDKIRNFFGSRNRGDVVHAVLNNQEFLITFPDGTIQRMERDSIIRISILTTDQGPWAEDVFWSVSDGEQSILVPQECPDFSNLLDQFGQWPGFDYERVIEAMGSTSNNEFICWEKPAAPGKEGAA